MSIHLGLKLSEHGLHFFHSEALKNLVDFKSQADGIMAKRLTPVLEDVQEKVYMGDLFGND